MSECGQYTHTHTHTHTRVCVCVCEREREREFVCVVCLCLDGALSILIIVKGLPAPPEADGVAKLPPGTVGLKGKKILKSQCPKHTLLAKATIPGTFSSSSPDIVQFSVVV